MGQKMTNADHECGSYACCMCGFELRRECDYASSITITMHSPIIKGDGQATLCFACAAKVNELIHPDIVTEPGYKEAKEQVLAHRAAHDRHN